MKKSRLALIVSLTLGAACASDTAYHKIRVELPSFSPLQLGEFQQAVFSGFIVGKQPDGLNLSKEIIDYFAPEFERKLRFQVSVQPVTLESEEAFRNADFWRSLAPDTARILYITGKAEMTRETRKAIMPKDKDELEDPWDLKKTVAERTVFTLGLHLFLIRGDTGEVVLDRDYKETRTYTNPNQRADFAFSDLAQRVKSKLFRLVLSEERMQERYLLMK